MGQKVNPCGFRLGITKEWDSVFFAKKNYGELLIQDLKIRKLINSEYAKAEVGRIELKYLPNKIIVRLHVNKPGVVIGKSGSDIDKLRKKIFKITNREVFIDVLDVKKADINATLVSNMVARQLEKRVSFRQAMKKAIEKCLKQGGEGIKISCSGRLMGADIARTEWYKEGNIPLHTLRADIDYGVAEAKTTYGIIGVKVAICKCKNVEN